MKYLLAFIAFASFTVPPSSQKDSYSRLQPCDAGDVITVDYCDLLRKPELYDQKVVRIQAIYRYGYEWSELYCPDCLTEGRTWVDFDELSETCTKSEVAKKIDDNGFKGRTASVLIVGKFYGSGSGYGHMNAYQFKFLASCVEQAKVILNDSPIPNAMPKKLLNQATCRTARVKRKSEGHQAN